MLNGNGTAEYNGAMEREPSEREPAGLSRAERERLLEIKPTQPFVWSSVAEEKRPFSSPRDEYLRSRYTFTPNQLAWRWQGLFPRSEVDLLFYEPTINSERMVMQWFQTRNAELPDLDDPQYRRQVVNLRLLALSDEIAQIEEQLRTKQIKRVEWVAAESGFGGTYKEMWRDMNATETSLARRDYERLVKLYQLLTGEATEITKSSVDITVTSEERKQALAELAQSRRALMSGDIAIEVFGQGENAPPIEAPMEAEVVA